MNIIYELDMQIYELLIVIISAIIIFLILLLLYIVITLKALKTIIKAPFIVLIVMMLVGLLNLDTAYITYKYQIEHEQYNVACGTLSLLSAEEIYFKGSWEPEYMCSLAIGDEIFPEAGYFSLEEKNIFESNPVVYFYYGYIRDEIIVWKIVEL